MQKQITLSGDDIDQLYKHDATSGRLSACEKPGNSSGSVIWRYAAIRSRVLPGTGTGYFLVPKQKFVKMNEKAKSLGWMEPIFVTVQDLHDPEHYSTARTLQFLCVMQCIIRYFARLPRQSDILPREPTFTRTGSPITAVCFKNMPDPSVNRRRRYWAGRLGIRM